MATLPVKVFFFISGRSLSRTSISVAVCYIVNYIWWKVSEIMKLSDTTKDRLLR